MAVEDLGVVARPWASVCVIKSGIGSSEDATRGVFFAPGDRRSSDPLRGVGVEASVTGVEGTLPSGSNFVDTRRSLRRRSFRNISVSGDTRCRERITTRVGDLRS